MRHEIVRMLGEVARGIVPILFIIILLQFSPLALPEETFFRFLLGAVFVSLGLFLFLIGVKAGLLPMGEMIGAELPKSGSATFLLVMSFVLGAAIAAAEPNVRVLSHHLDSISPGLIPNWALVVTISTSVGLCVVCAVLRILLRISISKIFVIGYILLFGLTFFASPKFLPVSFDSGGVVTGPVAVPFLIALGLGTARVLRGHESEGFGFVGLTALAPVYGVMLLGLLYQ